MLASIVSYGLAIGAVYALIGITYNVMFSASRVFSFTAGMLGMLGGVLGALFIVEWGLPVIVGLVLVLACGAAVTRALRLPLNLAPLAGLAGIAVLATWCVALKAPPLLSSGLIVVGASCGVAALL